MRCGTGTKSGDPSRVTAVTKSTIACFEAPSFQDGSGSPAAALCAPAGKSVSGKTVSTTRAESSVRRLTPEKNGVDDMAGTFQQVTSKTALRELLLGRRLRA